MHTLAFWVWVRGRGQGQRSGVACLKRGVIPGQTRGDPREQGFGHSVQTGARGLVSTPLPPAGGERGKVLVTRRDLCPSAGSAGKLCRQAVNGPYKGLVSQ